MKYLFSFLLVIILLFAVAVFGASSLPAWYDPARADSYHAIDNINQLIEKKSKQKFFEQKLADFLRGEVALDEQELNALLYTKLQQKEDGRKLLAVTDGVRALVKSDHIELGAVLNLSKLKSLDSDTRRKVNKYLEKLPVLKDKKVYLAVTGRPIARNGQLAIADDLTVKIGNIPVSASMLKSLGVKTDKLQRESVKIRNISITDVRLEDKRIIASVNPDL